MCLSACSVQTLVGSGDFYMVINPSRVGFACILGSFTADGLSSLGSCAEDPVFPDSPVFSHENYDSGG